MNQGAGIQLQVGLDLAFFRQQISVLGAAAAGYPLRFKVEFDRRSVQNELNALGRNIRQRTYRLEVATNLAAEIKHAGTLARALRNLGNANRATGGAAGSTVDAGKIQALVNRSTRPALQALYSEMSKADIPMGDVGKGTVKSLRSAILSGVPQLTTDLARGISKGLDPQMKESGTQGAKLFVDAFKSATGIASPSKVFKALGEFSADGLEIGFLNGLKDFKTKAVGEIKQIVALMKLELASVGGVNIRPGTEVAGTGARGRQYMNPIGPLPEGSREPWAFSQYRYQPFMAQPGQFRGANVPPMRQRFPFAGAPAIMPTVSPGMVGRSVPALPPAGGTAATRQTMLANRELEARARSAARAISILAEDAATAVSRKLLPAVAAGREALQRASGQVPLGGLPAGVRGFLPPAGGSGGELSAGSPSGSSLAGLYRQIAEAENRLREARIGGTEFELAAGQSGALRGESQRGEIMARAISSRESAQAFDAGSLARYERALESLRIQASLITPNTPEWASLQREIGEITLGLKQADRAAESIQLTQQLGALAPGSLSRLETQLTVLRNRARDISPDTSTWRRLNKEIQRTETSIERVSRKPLRAIDRVGAAGGAFLYGGGLGGGAGSALGGIAGGLVGGVPAAFAGAAAGQLVDNLGTTLAGITSQASKVQQLQRGLALASIDAKDFAEAQSAVADVSARLFIPLEQVTKSFAQLRVNTKQYNLSVEETRQILEGTILAVSSVGGSADDVDSAMRAVVQILSKGSVQAEELRGQLGERFPGAVVKFAQANKLSFEALQQGLEAGQIGIKEFVNFAKQNYADYSEFSKTLATAPEFAGRRLAKAFEEMQLAIGQVMGSSGAMIQNFASQALKDITQFVVNNRGLLTQLGTDFATVFSGIASVVAETGKFIIQVLAPVFSYIGSVIRQLRVMTGAADAATSRTEMTASFALMKKHGPGRAKGSPIDTIEYNKAAARYETAERQFKAAGGSAALPSEAATLQNLTFGGPGAGMDLGRQAKPEKGGKAAGRKLKEFDSQRTQILERRLEAEKAAIDANLLLSERERSIEKARLDFKYRNQIIDEQLTQARRISQEYQLKDRERFIAEQEQLAAIQRKALESGFVTGIAPELSQGYQGLLDAYDSLTLKQEALTRGKNELNEVERAEIFLNKIRAGLQPEELARVDALASAYLMEAKALDLATASYEKQLGLREALKPLERQLQLAQILDPKAELRAQIRQEQPKLDDQGVEQVARLQEQVNAAQKFKTDLQGIASTIGDAFGNAFKGIVTGSMSAREALGGFFQGVADSFADMVAKMIAEYMKMQLVEGIMNIVSMLSPGFGTGIAPGPVAKSAGVKFSPTKMGPAFANGGIAAGGFTAFANGGIVTGPTLGLVGEGRYNEAVIPLPDGKSVPVDLGGAMGNQITSNSVVNVSSDGKTSSSGAGADSAGLGRKLEGAVKQVILDELSPGGILAGRR
jgi:tape measure domain-containing protein